ncbi:phage holin, partial [Listeria monocytogenes]
NSVFLLLGVLGVVNDPTTQGTSDSELVLNKNKKGEDDK